LSEWFDKDLRKWLFAVAQAKCGAQKRERITQRRRVNRGVQRKRARRVVPLREKGRNRLGDLFGFEGLEGGVEG
jgi:hypothetical protein